MKDPEKKTYKIYSYDIHAMQNAEASAAVKNQFKIMFTDGTLHH